MLLLFVNGLRWRNLKQLMHLVSSMATTGETPVKTKVLNYTWIRFGKVSGFGVLPGFWPMQQIVWLPQNSVKTRHCHWFVCFVQWPVVVTPGLLVNFFRQVVAFLASRKPRTTWIHRVKTLISKMWWWRMLGTIGGLVSTMKTLVFGQTIILWWSLPRMVPMRIAVSSRPSLGSEVNFASISMMPWWIVAHWALSVPSRAAVLRHRDLLHPLPVAGDYGVQAHAEGLHQNRASKPPFEDEAGEAWKFSMLFFCSVHQCILRDSCGSKAFYFLIPLLPCLDIPCSDEYQSPCNGVGGDTGIQCDNHVIFSVENYWCENSHLLYQPESEVIRTFLAPSKLKGYLDSRVAGRKKQSRSRLLFSSFRWVGLWIVRSSFAHPLQQKDGKWHRFLAGIFRRKTAYCSLNPQLRHQDQKSVGEEDHQGTGEPTIHMVRDHT